MTRVITGLLLAGAAWALAFLAPRPLFLGLGATVATLALREFYGIARACGWQPLALAGYAASWLWICLPGLDVGLLTILLALAALGAGFVSGRPVSSVLPSAASTLTGVVYIAGPLALGALLHARSPHWLVLLLVTNGVGDSAALYVGRALGRHPLAPRTSPAKTWEGAAGSLVCGILAGTLYAAQFLRTEIGLVDATVLALAVNCAAQIGDLAESGMKRAAGMKDSSSLLPGHGGVLDRIDGLLFSTPVAYAHLLVFG